MLKLGSIFLFLLIAQANGCAPGSGILGTKATFDFVMNPPIMYTYCDDQGERCDDYTQLGKDFASRTVKSDVQNSINEVLQANSIPTNDINPPVITYTPPNTLIAPAGSNCTSGNFENQTIPVDQTLYHICEKKEGKDVNAPFIVDLSVQVTAVQSIYQSQWNALASQVEDKLRAKRGANFYADPIVTVSN